MSSREQITLRPAQPSDLEFSFEVTEATMRGYVESTWGQWEPSFQHERHTQSFNPRTHQVILFAGEAAGILAVEQHHTHVLLEKLYILPRFQNQGIGSVILQDILRGARSQGKPVRLRTLTVNAAAQRFYQRHGFVITEHTPERVFMETIS